MWLFSPLTSSWYGHISLQDVVTAQRPAAGWIDSTQIPSLVTTFGAVLLQSRSQPILPGSATCKCQQVSAQMPQLVNVSITQQVQLPTHIRLSSSTRTVRSLRCGCPCPCMEQLPKLKGSSWPECLTDQLECQLQQPLDSHKGPQHLRIEKKPMETCYPLHKHYCEPQQKGCDAFSPSCEPCTEPCTAC